MKNSFDLRGKKAPPPSESAACGKLECGDKVCLRSGGPVMTVSMLGDHLVFCVWFTEDECCGEDWFNPACLEYVP